MQTRLTRTRGGRLAEPRAAPQPAAAQPHPAAPSSARASAARPSDRAAATREKCAVATAGEDADRAAAAGRGGSAHPRRREELPEVPLPGRGAPPGGPGPAARTAARRSVPLASTRRRRPGCAPGPGSAQLGREHGAARGAAAGELRPARGERPVGGGSWAEGSVASCGRAVPLVGSGSQRASGSNRWGALAENL